jgi:hypothetical protein
MLSHGEAQAPWSGRAPGLSNGATRLEPLKLQASHRLGAGCVEMLPIRLVPGPSGASSRMSVARKSANRSTCTSDLRGQRAPASHDAPSQLRASTVFRSRCALVCPCSLDPHHGRLVLAARYQSHGFLSPRQAPKRTAARSLLTLPASHPCLGSFLHPSPKESAPTRHRRRAMRLVRRPPTSLPSVVPLRRRTPVTATPT